MALIPISLGIFKVSVILLNIDHSKHEHVRRADLDDTWDYEILPFEGEYWNYSIGMRDNIITVIGTASAPTVEARKKVIELNSDYTTKEDYYKNGGPDFFRSYLEKNK